MSDPYRISALRINVATTRWGDVVALIAIVPLGYALGGPIWAATLPLIALAVVVISGQVANKNTDGDGHFEVWPDGSYRCTRPGSTLDSNLGAAISVRRSRAFWQIKIAPRVIVLVPTSAFDEASTRQMERLVANRRAPQSPYIVYSVDPLTTLPYDSQLAPILRANLALFVRMWAVLFVGLVVLQVGIEGPDEFWRNALVNLVGTAALALMVPTAVAARFAYEIGNPNHRNQRICIQADGLEAYGALGSSKVQRSQIKKVDSRRYAIVLHVPRALIIPATAFRDPDHRRAFEAALTAMMTSGPGPTPRPGHDPSDN